MKTLILSGKSGSGKDVFANFLKQELELQGQKVIIIHYADPVKWFCKEYYNWNGVKDEAGRTLLQTLGTDKVRSSHPNYWAGLVVGFLTAIEPFNDFDVAIIPDARFENEVEITMTNLNPSTCIRIERKNSDGSAWVNPTLTEEQRNHPSEISLDKYGFDYIIHNDEGLDVFKESAHTLLVDMGLIKGELND